MAVLAGANILYGAGLLESGISFSHAQLVIDNDIFKMIKYMLKGIPVNDYTMALDLIQELGPGGDYMLSDLTMENYKTIGSQPALLDRQNRSGWELTLGGKDMAELAAEKASYILANHKPENPLSDEVLREMRRIVEDADEEFKEHQE